MKEVFNRITALPEEKQKILLCRLEQAAGENFRAINEHLMPLKETDNIPLSFAQKRMWFLNQLDPDSPYYNMSAAAEISGRLDPYILNKTLSAITDRHQILRSYYTISDGEPLQHIRPASQETLTIIDLKSLPSVEKEAKIDELIKNDALLRFDLHNGPLYRFTLLIAAEERFILLITFHHIVSDGWSVRLFLDEFMELYLKFSNSADYIYSYPELQYSDYTAWQLKNYGSDNYKKQLSYWILKIKDLPGTLELPFSKPRPRIQTYNGRVLRFLIPGDLKLKIAKMSQERNLTVYMIGLAAFQALLFRYTNQEKFGIGTLWTNRNRRELEDLIGFFVNTLIIRADLNNQISGSELLSQVKNTVLIANEYQDFPFEHLVDLLADQHTLSYNPLVQIMFDYQTDAAAGLTLPDMNISILETETSTSKFDLLFIMKECKNSLECSIEYNTDLYDESSICRLSQHYLNILDSITGNPAQKISEIDYLSAAEKQDIYRWNSTGKEFAGAGTLVDLLEEQVRKTPGLTALKFKDKSYTFSEVNSFSNLLASRLAKSGTGKETFIGICVERSAEMLVGIYGILKAGGAFVPIDPNYPAERISYILKDAGIKILLTQSHLISRIPVSSELEIVNIEEFLVEQQFDNLTEKPFKENAAYMIYTSGTTGKPKGAIISHESIVNRLLWMRDKYNFSPAETVIQKTPYSFDVSLWEIFSPLLNGVKLIMAEPGGHLDSVYLIDTVIEEGVTMMHFVPSMLALILENSGFKNCSSLKRVFCSGEELTFDLQEKFFRQLPDTQLIDLFGPTEAAIEVTEWICIKNSPLHKVPIGMPIANTQAYVLDKNFRLLPPGISGELFLGGIQLSRGYHKMAPLTAEKFIPDPSGRTPGARLYRTGDLARLMEDGNIEFLGRIDFQIKIRGIRVEPAEAEIIIRHCFDVKDVAVIPRSTPSGDKQLVAYIIPVDHTMPDAGSMKTILSDKLPDYLIPSAFVFLEKFPVNQNGKLDRKSLPAPSENITDDKIFVEPGNPLENMIVEIWKDILKIDRISILDNFFEIGGNSLQAAVMINRLQDKLKKRIHVKNIFLHPTPAELAGYLNEELKTDFNENIPLEDIPIVSRSAEIPLSYEQERLWFFSQLEGGNPFYNISFAALIQGKLNTQALENSINEVISRHEILRSSYLNIDGKPVCSLLSELKIFLPVNSTAPYFSCISREELIKNLLQKEAGTGIDLAHPPLLRIKLFELSPGEHLLTFSFHHIIFDGWSVSVFFEELKTHYLSYTGSGNGRLSELKIQYADYAGWRNKIIEGSEKQILYWQQKLSDAPPVLNLPSDFKRPAVKTYKGSRYNFTLPGGLADRITEFAASGRSTVFNVLLASLKVLLWKYSGCSDICIGVPVNTRRRSELEALIGYFINSIVMRTVINPLQNFHDLVSSVSQTANEAYANQDVPLDIIIDRIGIRRDLSHSPLFQVMFDFQDKVIKNTGFADLTFKSLDVENNSAKFDLLFSFHKSEAGLEGFLEYSTDLFTIQTIHRMIRHFTVLLERLINEPAKPVRNQTILLNEEAGIILKEWNCTPKLSDVSSTIHSAFEEQVRITPEQPAVFFAGNRLSYFQLNRLSNLLASRLINAGVKPETRVGICLERSLETVISIFGILKAGGCYIPLDVSYPESRIKAVLSESGMHYLITTEKLKKYNIQSGINIIDIDFLKHIPESEQADDPRVEVYPENCAYIIYTSGSTGIPKGVMISHRSVLNLLNGLKKAIYSGFPGKLFNASLNAPVSFDASVQQLVLLLGGHTLYILPDEVRTSDTALASFIADNAIDVFDCVPSQLKFLMDFWAETEGIKKPLICLPGGEAIEDQLWNRISELKETKFFNMYGPTECTVDSTVCAVTSSKGRPVIGRPLENISAYILDRQMQLQPPGIAGEIYIGELAVARCYADNAALTAEFFLPDPFSSTPGSRLYRSGDAGRFIPDGSIEYLGRTDNQVKIKGFRIELGDIESALLSHPDIKNAAVIVREDNPGLKRLTAYIVFASPDNTVNATELISYLKLRIPDYMVPHIFVALDTLPLTPSGKTDRLRLPRPEMQHHAVSSGLSPAKTENEKILQEVFSEVLGLQTVGIDDNFFELGGDSIISIQAVTKARRKGLNITVKNIFQFPTVRELALLNPSSRSSGNERLRPGDEIVLAPVQKWFFSKHFPQPDHWNQSVFIELAEDVSLDLLEKAFNHVVNFHESFSFRFTCTGDEWKQYYIPSGQYTAIKEYDLSRLSIEESSGKIYTESSRLQSSLDIRKGPLFVIAAFREPGCRQLFIAVHHLIVDGITWRIILEDIQNAYMQFAEGKTVTLPPAAASYAAWSSLFNHHLPENILDRSLSYFSSLPSDKLKALPRDFANGQNLEECSSSILMSLSEEDSVKLLLKLNVFPGFSVQDILLAACAKTLASWTESEDIFFDMESHGREELFPGIDISRTAGWFTSIFPVHLKTGLRKTAYEVLASVHNQMENLPPFIYDLRIPGSGPGLEEKFSALNRIEISFNYLGRLDQQLRNGLVFKSLTKNKTVDRSHACPRIYLIDIAFEISNGRLNSYWTFSSACHKKITIEKLASGCLREILNIINTESMHIQNISLLTDLPNESIDERELNNILNELNEGGEE